MISELAIAITGNAKLAKRLKGGDWTAFVAALVAGKYAFRYRYDHEGNEHEDSYDFADTTALLARAKAANGRFTLPATAFAWHDAGQQDHWGPVPIVNALATAISMEGIGVVRLHLADRDEAVIAFVPWDDRASIVAGAKALREKIEMIGPKKPKPPPRAAKPRPTAAKRVHLRGCVFHPYKILPRAHALVVSTSRGAEELVDLSAWPPIRRTLRPFRCETLAIHANGKLVGSVRGYSNEVRSYARGATALCTPAVPDNLESMRLEFVGDDLVLFPHEWCYRAKSVTRPLICRAGTTELVELLELPPAKPIAWSNVKACAFLRQGFARTGDGADVVIWERGGYTLAGKTWVRRFELPKTTPGNYSIATAPGTGDAFYALVDRSVVEIRAGKKPVSRLLLETLGDRIVAGPDGAILVSASRPTPKAPMMFAWWPERREYAEVHPALFGFTPSKKNIITAHGFAAKSGLAWCYETIAEELRAIAWQAVAALPRKPE